MRLAQNASSKLSAAIVLIVATLSFSFSVIYACHAPKESSLVNVANPVPQQGIESLAGALEENGGFQKVGVGAIFLILFLGRKHLVPRQSKSGGSVKSVPAWQKFVQNIPQKYSFSLSLPQLGVSRT